MNNPCKQCLVNPMCISGCDELAEYIEIRDLKSDTMIWNYGIIARSVREGTIILFNDDKEWKYLGCNQYE